MLTIHEEFEALCNIKKVSDNLDDALFEKLGGTINRATINKIKKYFDVKLPSDNINKSESEPVESKPVEQEPIKKESKGE